MRRTPTIVIVGGSISGLAAASVLRRSGYQVLVVERSGPLGDQGAGLAVDTSLIAEVTGRARGQVCAVPVSASNITLRRPDGRVSTRQAPMPFHVTTWKALHEELSTAAQADTVLSSPVKTLTQSADAVQIEFTAGHTIDADAVVLADGYLSRLRSCVDPDASPPSYAGYTLLRGVLPECEVPRDLRPQVFDGRMHLLNREPYYGVLYAMPGPGGAREPGRRRLTWAVYYPLPHDQMREALSDSAGNHRNTVLVGGLRDGVAQNLLSVIDEPTWPGPWRRVADETLRMDSLMASTVHEFTPRRLASDRVVLLGDAAHVASPITGSGSAAALKDALALKTALHEAPVAAITEAFAGYEQARLTASQELVEAGKEWGRQFLTPGVTPNDPPVFLGRINR